MKNTTFPYWYTCDVENTLTKYDTSSAKQCSDLFSIAFFFNVDSSARMKNVKQASEESRLSLFNTEELGQLLHSRTR